MLTTDYIKIQFILTSDTSSFPFAIRYFEASDINVEIVDTTATILTTKILVMDADFTVTPVNGDPKNGATIDTTETYTTGDVVTIYRKIPETQLADFQRGGDLPPDVLNAALDRSVALSQQLSDDSLRRLSCPITDIDNLNYELPIVELRKNRAVGFDENGNVTALSLSDTGSIAVDNAKGLTMTDNIISCKVNETSMIFDDFTGELSVGEITKYHIKTGNVTLEKIENIPDMRVLGNTSGNIAHPETIMLYDSDNLVENSNKSLATQQSIKIYVDTLRTYVDKQVPDNVVKSELKGLSTYTGVLSVIGNSDPFLNTEGAEIFGVSITPKSSTSNIRISGGIHIGSNGGHRVIALFRDSETSPLAVWAGYSPDNTISTIAFDIRLPSLSTSVRTYKLRAGVDTTSFNLNGSDNIGWYDNKLYSNIIVEEVVV